MQNYFDTHCHLDFLSNTDLAVAEARACGVNRILVPSVHPENFLKTDFYIGHPSLSLQKHLQML